MQSCDEMQQEIAETGENRYCIEEEVDSELENEDESSNSSDSSSGSNSSNSSQQGCYSFTFHMGCELKRFTRFFHVKPAFPVLISSIMASQISQM